MTEAEWLVHDSPVALLAHLNADGYSRKLLLYASALCALRPELLIHSLQHWAAAVEAVLAGDAPPNSLDHWQEDSEAVCSHLAERAPPELRAYYAMLCDVVFCTWVHDPLERDVDYYRPAAAELAPLRRFGAGLIRDIYGNPFRPVSFSSTWRTDTAVSLARAMYGARDFSAMPILADALQDAGCDSDDVLTHCRDPKQAHLRGCWVVDLVLGKT
jgi:hypothetical protein